MGHNRWDSTRKQWLERETTWRRVWAAQHQKAIANLKTGVEERKMTPEESCKKK